MSAMTMPVQIVAPCPKRPASSTSTCTNNNTNNSTIHNQEIQDACHQELRQILTSTKQPNPLTTSPTSMTHASTSTTTTATMNTMTPKLPGHQIPRTDNPLPQDMTFFTSSFQPCLPTTKSHHHRPRSYSVGDNGYSIYIKKNNDLVH
ncbi:hypothetical protein BDA99DRAFT_493891 [Phascolomyces articulosus]|uniref:Uncharacterized protein n=1 Tax=Phascolomyces articulosus TaxID=60185 RepID=A0AAD5PJC8_9FUNG|nr:hypothetical protein BDA99DRAFT_493891 [Phascolomyces articulosus]